MAGAADAPLSRFNADLFDRSSNLPPSRRSFSPAPGSARGTAPGSGRPSADGMPKLVLQLPSGQIGTACTSAVSPSGASSGAHSARKLPLVDMGRRMPNLDMTRVVRPGDGGADPSKSQGASFTSPRLSLGTATFADPKTFRFNYEEITSGRGSAPLNPLCKELYLSDSEFQEVFQMDKQSFYALKLWRQRELKKEAGLF